MQARPSDWVAGIREYRLATVSAIAVSLLLVLLLVKPSWFLPEQTHVANKAVQPKIYSLPVKVIRNNPNGNKKITQTPVPRIVEKRSAPKTGKIPPVKTTVRHPPSRTTNRQMENGNGLKYGYYVQVGAFKDTAKAKKMAALLQHSGWHAQIISKKNNLHAVLAGPLKTRKKAEKAKLKLARQSGIKGYIISITPDKVNIPRQSRGL